MKTKAHWTLDVHFGLNNDGKLDGQAVRWWWLRSLKDLLENPCEKQVLRSKTECVWSCPGPIDHGHSQLLMTHGPISPAQFCRDAAHINIGADYCLHPNCSSAAHTESDWQIYSSFYTIKPCACCYKCNEAIHHYSHSNPKHCPGQKRSCHATTLFNAHTTPKAAGTFITFHTLNACTGARF